MKVKTSPCIDTKLKGDFGRIEFFPVAVTRPIFDSCNWTFVVPEQRKNYILHLEFKRLNAYDFDDDINLPDGKQGVYEKANFWKFRRSVCSADKVKRHGCSCHLLMLSFHFLCWYHRLLSTLQTGERKKREEH